MRQTRAFCVLDGTTLAVRQATATLLLRIADIRAARSNRNHTTILSAEGELVVRAPLQELVGALDEFGVLRVHRRYAVNLAAIKRIVGRGRHELVIVLVDGNILPVGRSHQRSIRMRYGLRSVAPRFGQGGLAH